VSNIIERLGSLLADNIIGRDGTSKIFVKRYTVHFPDYDFIEKVDVKENQPYMALIISSYVFNSNYHLANKKAIQTISDIDHQGTSAASYVLTGTHRGNNNFVIRIAASGALGTAQYQWSKDGGDNYTNAQVVPPNGQIINGDGTTFTFGSEGNLVMGDVYTWETVSMMELTYCTDAVVYNVSIQLYTATKIELFGNTKFTGYLDQLRQFFVEHRAINDSEYIYRVSLNKKAQPYSDTRAGKYRGLLTIVIEGALYHKKQVPIIGTTTVEAA
jgi:hypothetical protein